MRSISGFLQMYKSTKTLKLHFTAGDYILQCFYYWRRSSPVGLRLGCKLMRGWALSHELNVEGKVTGYASGLLDSCIGAQNRISNCTKDYLSHS